MSDPTGLAALQAPPAAYQALRGPLASLDQCLALGFGRLGLEQHDALASLGRALSGTPLGERFGQATSSLRQGEFREGHFLTVAAARAALHGALYDALAQQVAAALGRAAPVVPAAAELGAAVAAPLLESTRHWLMEIALAGFNQLEPEAILPFQATLERLQADAGYFRLSSLLTGFCGELLALAPTAAQPPGAVPLHRWADLWTRAALLSARPWPAVAAEDTVQGDLRILGADLRAHAFAISLVVHGVVAGPDGARLIRLTRSAYKVDVAAGREVRRTLPAPQLLRALAEGRLLALPRLPLLPSGDALYGPEADQQAKVAGSYDPWLEAVRFLPRPPQGRTPLWRGVVPLLDRHPALLAEPLMIERLRLRPEPAQGGVMAEMDNGAVLIDTRNQVGTAETTNDKVGVAQRVFGLLRFDGGRFRLKPLAVHGGGAGKQLTALAGQNAAATALSSISVSPIGKLRERASKLLREKA